MRTRRRTLLSIVDACASALLVVALSGCVTTPATKPSNYRDRTGDFVTNIASTTAGAGFMSQSAVKLPRA